MMIDYILILLLILMPVGVVGVSSCSNTQAMSEARENAPLVGEVQDVNIVPKGGLRGGHPNIYLQVDDELYRFISDGPAPAEGSVIEYRVIDDQIFDVVKVDDANEKTP